MRLPDSEKKSEIITYMWVVLTDSMPKTCKNVAEKQIDQKDNVVCTSPY